MNKLKDIHREAIELAKLAIEARDIGDKKLYYELSKQAFSLEKQAAYMLFANLETEPTRSVLFRSAATLAYNCGMLEEAQKLIYCAFSGSPHFEIKEELNLLLKQVEAAKPDIISEVEEESFVYLGILRAKAICLKIEPKTKKYSKAILIDNIIDFLKNIKASFVNYSRVNFIKVFEQSEFKNFQDVLNNFLKESSPFCVDFNWNSFGVSIVSDTVIVSEQNSDKISEWKRNLFEEYKKEVLLSDYSSEQFIRYISEKYSKEERQQIYSNIVDVFKEGTSYKVSLTNNNFKTILKEYTPVSKPVKEILVPKIDNEEKEETKKLFRTFGLAPTDSQGIIKKKDIIESQQIDYAELSYKTTQFAFGDKVLYLKEQYETKMIYEMGDFIINDTQFNLYFSSDDYGNTIQTYHKKMIDLYSKIILTTSELTTDEQIIKVRFDDIVFSRDW
jgi:hypothetical protein